MDSVLDSKEMFEDSILDSKKGSDSILDSNCLLFGILLDSKKSVRIPKMGSDSKKQSVGFQIGFRQSNGHIYDSAKTQPAICRLIECSGYGVSPKYTK